MELMVVLTVWSGLLVIILSFYIYATKVTKRHEKISDQYRKIHLILESLEGYLGRSRIYALGSSAKLDPVFIIFSRPLLPDKMSPYGVPLWDTPETISLEPNPEYPVEMLGIYPMRGQLVLRQQATPVTSITSRVLIKLDPATKIDFSAPDIEPDQGTDPLRALLAPQHLLQVKISFPIPSQTTGKIASIGDLKGEAYKIFTRLILLENAPLPAP